MYLAIVPDQNHFNDTSKKFDKVSIYLFCIATLLKSKATKLRDIMLIYCKAMVDSFLWFLIFGHFSNPTKYIAVIETKNLKSLVIRDNKLNH